MLNYYKKGENKRNLQKNKRIREVTLGQLGLKTIAIFFFIMVPIVLSCSFMDSLKKLYAIEMNLPQRDYQPKENITAMHLYVDSLNRHWWSVTDELNQSEIRLVAENKAVDINNYILNDTDLNMLLTRTVNKYKRIDVMMVIHVKNHHRDFVNIVDEIGIVNKKFYNKYTSQKTEYISYNFREWTQHDDSLIANALKNLNNTQNILQTNNSPIQHSR